jgi:hypothetical protein
MPHCDKMLAMAKTDQPLLGTSEARHRLKEAMRLQEIEGNPLNAEQIAMFEMFEREGWSEARCLEHVIRRARKRAAGARTAAE